MAVADILSGLGKGLETVGKAAVPVLERTAQVVSGEAPQIDEDQRKRQEKLEDEQIAAKASILESGLATGQKYGTLTPEQQQQYIDQLTGLYSHPRHAGTLMEKLRKAIHPNGAYAAGPQAPLTNPVPEGGTAAADEAKAEKLAQARYHAVPKKGFEQFAEKYAQAHGIGSADDLTEAQLEDAHVEYGKSTRAERLQTKIVQDPSSPTGFAASTFDAMTGKEISSFPGVVPPRGMVPTERRTESKDIYGNTTYTVSQITPEIGKGANPAQSTTGATPVEPKRIGGLLSPVRPAGQSKPVIPSGPKQLDAQGHIPDGVGNGQVREAANELLDGQDINKIPIRAREAAASLARQYGWQQGTFTPKEQVLLKESSTFLQEAANNPSLSVLDSPASRIRLQQLIGDPSKKGFMGHIGTNIAAATESPQEAEFIRMYNQLVGTISGLAQLTRSGRATEQTINRLVNELPNPYTTTSSADAKARLARLQQELTVAQTKGNLGSVSPASALSGGVVNVSPEDL